MLILRRRVTEAKLRLRRQRHERRGDPVAIERHCYRDIDNQRGSLFSTSGDTEITVPSGAFTDTVILNYRLLWTDQDTADLVGIGHTIDIRAVYSDTGKTARLAPGKTIGVVINYANTGMAIENTLAMYGWDASSAAWTQDNVSSILDAGLNRIEAEIEHLSMFAVLGETNRIWLPLVVK